MKEAKERLPRASKDFNISPADVPRFWAKVEKKGPDECWLWKAGSKAEGYGMFWVDGKTRKASRVAYTIEKGKIPDDGTHHGTCVCHKCDNPACCNPAHLFLGTTMDNTADRHAKGRSTRGGTNGNSKLIEAQVIEIRALYAAGGISMRKVALKFNVDTGLVHLIVKRRIWKHV